MRSLMLKEAEMPPKFKNLKYLYKGGKLIIINKIISPYEVFYKITEFSPEEIRGEKVVTEE